MRFIQTFVELANMRLAVIGPLANVIGMMDVQTESSSLSYLLITLSAPPKAELPPTLTGV